MSPLVVLAEGVRLRSRRRGGRGVPERYQRAARTDIHQVYWKRSQKYIHIFCLISVNLSKCFIFLSKRRLYILHDFFFKGPYLGGPYWCVVWAVWLARVSVVVSAVGRGANSTLGSELPTRGYVRERSPTPHEHSIIVKCS